MMVKIEWAAQPGHAGHEAERCRLANADWWAAGGPISFVRGRTREEAVAREAVLSQRRMIQPLDKVVRLPLQAETEEPFLLHHVIRDWTAEKRDAIKSPLAAPSPLFPAGWVSTRAVWDRLRHQHGFDDVDHAIRLHHVPAMAPLRHARPLKL